MDRPSEIHGGCVQQRAPRYRREHPTGSGFFKQGEVKAEYLGMAGYKATEGTKFYNRAGTRCASLCGGVLHAVTVFG